MTERWCKKCNKMCHCPNAEGECTNCSCNEKEDNKRMYKTHQEWANDMSYENEGGLEIDSTGECEACP